MSISSTSTLAQVLAQYNDNLSWEGDATKAAAALEAIRWLLVNRPAEFSQGNRTNKYSLLENEKNRLEAFLAVASTASTSKMTSFTRGKMIL